MTVGALAAYQIAEDDGPVIAGTMLLTTLSLFHVVPALLSRDQRNTIFDRAAVPEAVQLRRYALALLAIILITVLDFLQRIFGTAGLTFAQWCICGGIALSLLVVEELIKLVIRRRGPIEDALPTQTSPMIPAAA
jgi:Ca2+-transporting ATPase